MRPSINVFVLGLPEDAESVMTDAADDEPEADVEADDELFDEFDDGVVALSVWSAWSAWSVWSVPEAPVSELSLVELDDLDLDVFLPVAADESEPDAESDEFFLVLLVLVVLGLVVLDAEPESSEFDSAVVSVSDSVVDADSSELLSSSAVGIPLGTGVVCLR